MLHITLVQFYIFNYSVTYDHTIRRTANLCIFFFFILHYKICLYFIHTKQHKKDMLFLSIFSIDNNFMFWFHPPPFRCLLRNYVQRTHWKLVSIERQQKPFSYSYHCWVLLTLWLWLGQMKEWVVTFLL